MSPQASQNLPNLQLWCWPHDCLATVRQLKRRPLWTYEAGGIITEESDSADRITNRCHQLRPSMLLAAVAHILHLTTEPPLRCGTEVVLEDVFPNLVRILWTSNPSSDDNAIACAHRATAPATKEVRRTPRPAPLALPWWLARSASTQPTHHSMSDPNSRVSISHDSLILSHKPHMRLTVGARRFDR